MYVCMYVYMYVCMYIRMYVCICICICIQIQVLQVTAIGARTGREAPVEYVLKRTQSGALCGTYTSGTRLY